jgi:sugar phosphate isomerase/epimerase
VKHEIGCSTLGWHFFDLDTALSEIKSLQFGLLDIAMIPSFCPHFDPVRATAAEKDALKRSVREAGFKVATLNTFSGFLGESEDRESALAFLRASLALAKEFGAYGLCIQSGKPREPEGWQKAAEALARDLQLLGTEAESLGLDIAIEVHREMLVSNSSEAMKLMKLVDHPRIGITLDPCHIVYAGEDPSVVARRLGPWVRHVHLRDAIGKNTEVVPGDGSVDFAALVASLDSIGYSRPMMLELEYPARPGPGAVRADAERARKLLKGIFASTEHVR